MRILNKMVVWCKQYAEELYWNFILLVTVPYVHEKKNELMESGLILGDPGAVTQGGTKLKPGSWKL